MPTEQKTRIVDELYEALSRCNIGVLTDYRGITAAEINILRRKLRQSDIEYRVVKNTLVRLAAKKAGMENLGNAFEGPVAVALGYGEVTEPAKVLVDYIRTSKSTLTIKGGFLEDRVLTAGEIEALSALPAREVLLSQVVAGFQGPIVSLVGVLAAPIRGMIGVLQARIQQLEGG